jgi:hypothetical protein
MSPDNGKDSGDGQPTAGAAHNAWDAVVAAIVIGALVGLVVFLVRHYGKDTEKIAAVLGVAAPVLAAAFGVSIGYYSGNKAGQSTGKEAGKQQVAQKLQPIVDRLKEDTQQGILDRLTTAADSPPGSASYRLAEMEIPKEHVDRSNEAVGALEGVIFGAT